MTCWRACFAHPNTVNSDPSLNTNTHLHCTHAQGFAAIYIEGFLRIFREGRCDRTRAVIMMYVLCCVGRQAGGSHARVSLYSTVATSHSNLPYTRRHAPHTAASGRA